MAKGAINVQITGDYNDKDINRAIRDLNSLKSQAVPTTSALGGVGKAFVGMAGAFAVGTLIGNVTDYLQQAAQAAMEDEKSVRALSEALKNVGMGAAAKEAETLVSAFSKQFAVADDDLRPALQQLVTATGDLDKAQGLLQTALDVSAATGKDLTTVSLALSKAANGNVGALTRLGIPLDASIVKTKNFGAALEVVNQRFGGQAAAAADTYAGQLKSVQIAADEAKETIGYALLDAISNTSEALGGKAGLTDGIAMAGETLADFVAGIGVLITSLAELRSAVEVPVSDNSFLQGIVTWSQNIVTAINPAVASFRGLTSSGSDFRFSQERLNNSISGSESLYAGYIASLDGAAAAQRDLEMDAEDAKQALEELKAAVKGVMDEINQSQSMDDFRFKLAHLDKDLAKNSRSFDGLGVAAKKNRDTLRESLSMAQQSAQDFAGEGVGALERFQARYAELGADIVRTFVDAGFKRKDIRAFLKDAGLWTAELERIFRGIDPNDESQKMGYLLGLDLTKGVVKGIVAGSPAIKNQAARIVREAEEAARQESQTQSPSKKWAVLGSDLVDGLIEGLDSKKDEVAQKAAETLQGISDKAQSIVDDWKSTLTDLRSKLADAKGDIADFMSNTQQNLMSGFKPGNAFQAAVGEDGKLNVQKWLAGTEEAFGAFEWYNNVLTKIKEGGGSDALIAYLQSEGQEAGAAQGQAMLDNGLIWYFNAHLQNVEDVAGTTAQAMVPAFLIAAQDQAKATLDEFRDKYGKGAPYRNALEGLMDRLAKSLERTTTITVKTVYEAAGIDAPHRAAGGPVTGGSPYMVGERGPELFVPNTSGYVVANGDLRSGTTSGGNSYSITVQAGVGDPRQIGQQVVEYIKRFEKSSGAVFAPAA